MKITLESTQTIVAIEDEHGKSSARLWVGTNEKGVPVHAYIAAISPQTHDPAAHIDFERDLLEINGVRVSVDFPPKQERPRL